MNSENKDLEELIKKMVIKKLEEEMNQPSSYLGQGGGTTINIAPPNDAMLLLYLYLMKHKDEPLAEEGEDLVNWEELINKVDLLQKKNMQFLHEISKNAKVSD
ncbi:hypothetical protein [Alteribacillus sp. HJP-4]|uniref:hypothetical protein n=1 Tax=Alteribacillus sp. HJP-4 TaxID=2775394 RepID=UPI0035CD058D